MKAVHKQKGDASPDAIVALMVELCTIDDEYTILKLRRLLGPISVTPGKARAGPSLSWEQAPRLQRQWECAKTRKESQTEAGGAEVRAMPGIG